MVVLWKESLGRQPQSTLENEGGDETTYPSPPKFFHDPDPVGPSGPRKPPRHPDPSLAGDRKRSGAQKLIT